MLLLVKFSFTVEECNGQFQWGMNYKLEGLKLKQMLSPLRTGSELKTKEEKFVRIKFIHTFLKLK